MRTSYALSHNYAMPHRIMHSCIVLDVKPSELIKALVNAQGGSLAVAKAMRKPSFQGTLHKFMQGNVASPKRATAEALAAHFDLPIDAIYDEKAAAVAAKRLGVKEPAPGAVSTQASAQAMNREFPPAAKKTQSFPRSGIVTIRVNLAVPEAAVLHRMVHAAGLPGVVVEAQKWKGSTGSQLGKFSTDGVPLSPAPPGLAVVKQVRIPRAPKAPSKKDEK